MRFNRIYFFFLIAVAMLFYQCKHDPLIPKKDSELKMDSVCNSNTIYFQNDILPLIVSGCGKPGCHNSTSAADGIVLTDYQNIMCNGEIVPFDDTEGELIEVITSTNSRDVMPPAPYGALAPSQIIMIKNWIMQGAQNNGCAQSTVCDSINPTFVNNIFPLISNKCNGCHNSLNASSANGIDLSSYGNIQTYALNGLLYGAVNHEGGYSPMPKYQSKLQVCELVMIKKWIDDGAPNN
jgi:hypothetical protein